MRTAIIDVIGTFFSLDPLRQRLAALGAPEHTLELWFAEAERDAFAASLAGDYLPLEPVLAAVLPRTLAELGKGSQDPSRHELVLKGLRVLNPAPGALEAVARLGAAGFRLVALTHGSAEHAQALLDRAGVLQRFAAVVSADEARACRPHPAVYARVTPHVEGEPWLLTTHAWDVAGARLAGWRTAWIPRTERRFSTAFTAPDLQAPDLLACARRLTPDGVAAAHESGSAAGPG